MYHAAGYEAETLTALVTQIASHCLESDRDLPEINQVRYEVGHADFFFTERGVRMFRDALTKIRRELEEQWLQDSEAMEDYYATQRFHWNNGRL